MARLEAMERRLASNYTPPLSTHTYLPTVSQEMSEDEATVCKILYNITSFDKHPELLKEVNVKVL